MAEPEFLPLKSILMHSKLSACGSEAICQPGAAHSVVPFAIRQHMGTASDSEMDLLYPWQRLGGRRTRPTTLPSAGQHRVHRVSSSPAEHTWCASLMGCQNASGETKLRSARLHFLFRYLGARLTDKTQPKIGGPAHVSLGEKLCGLGRRLWFSPSGQCLWESRS